MEHPAEGLGTVQGFEINNKTVLPELNNDKTDRSAE